MPIPITKEAVKKARKNLQWPSSWKLRKHKILGYYLYDPDDDDVLSHAYSLYKIGFPHWVSRKDFQRHIQRRIKRGTKPRKKYIKQIMREPDFGLDEISIAERIINEAT